MLRSNLVRILLAAVLVVGIVSIVLSIHFRSGGIEPAPQPAELLPPEISRHSTGFEFSQLKEGRVVFKVYAKTSTMTESGEHQLDEVQLVGLDEQGRVTDRVQARGALYRIDEKEIEFQKDVDIRLVDGTEVLADRAEADLSAETVTIREAFRFSHGEFTGSGRGLFYRLARKLLDARRGLDLSFPVGDFPAHARAGSARYDLANGRVALRNGVRIESNDRRLEAESVAISLSPQSRITSLHATGGAELQLSAARRLSGDRIWIGFPATDGQTGSLISAAGQGETAAVRARFVETGPAGSQAMEGNRIVVPFRLVSDAGSSGISLNSLSTEGDVVIHSSAATLDDGRADRGRTEFDAATGELSRMILSGNVRLQGRFDAREGDDPPLQTLNCRNLDVQMRSPGEIESMQAEGPVELTSKSRQVQRRLEARDHLTALYRQGFLHRLTAVGNCRLHSREGGDSSLLTASRMELDFSDRGPSRAEATGGVRVETNQNGTTNVSRSDSLVLDYSEGVADEAVQSGSFSLDQQNSRGDKMHLSGDEARYDVQAGLLHVTARSRPELDLISERGTLRTSARTIHLNRVKEEVLAEKDVETTFEAGDRPSVVTAGQMKAALTTGEMEFTGDRPRLVQGFNLIQADNLQIDGGPGDLRAAGEVDSVWMDESGDAPREFRVQAAQLVLDSQTHHAVYEDRVRLDSEDLALKAPRLELFFLAPPQSGLDRLEAAGGVDIVEQGRHWRTERATYLRKTDQVVATK